MNTDTDNPHGQLALLRMERDALLSMNDVLLRQIQEHQQHLEELRTGIDELFKALRPFVEAAGQAAGPQGDVTGVLRAIDGFLERSVPAALPS